MTFEVFLTDDALGDLEAIGYYIAATDSPQQADYVLGKIEEAYLGLYELHRCTTARAFGVGRSRTRPKRCHHAFDRTV